MSALLGQSPAVFRRVGVAVLTAVWLSACAAPRPGAGRPGDTLADDVLRPNSPAPSLAFERARVITDNDTAFEAKLAAIRGARRSIDLAYYIYAEDHSMVFGPDLYVGSANADVRSYMLDTNNGLFIRGAPGLLTAYTAWVDGLVADTRLVEDRTAWFVDTARVRERTEDEAFVARRLRELTAGTGMDEKVPLEHLAARLTGLLDRAHELSAGIMGGGLLNLGAPRRFDRLFKLL